MGKRTLARTLGAAGLLALGAVPTAPQAAPGCGQLSALRIPAVRIVRTTAVSPDPVGMSPLAQPPEGLSLPVRKPFCRVEGTVEDEIGFELWLPDPADWTGRLLGTGNGGFAGFIRYEGLAKRVNRGFASRPVCAWPASLRYNGKGAVELAENRACVSPR